MTLFCRDCDYFKAWVDSEKGQCMHQLPHYIPEEDLDPDFTMNVKFSRVMYSDEEVCSLYEEKKR